MITAEKFINACDNGNIDIVRQYIAEGGDVNARDNDGWTGLMLAADWDNIDCLRELIAAGADIDARTYSGHTSIMIAFKAKRYIAAQLLAELGADIYAKDNEGKAAIDYCDDEKVREQLIQIYQQRLNTEVAIASSDKPEIIKGFDTER